MSWLIYKHTSPSGRCYIGQTVHTDDPNKRWQNGNGYKEHNSIFYAAIQKYGWSNFKHEVIEDGIRTKELANQREIYWIAQFDSYKNGYNGTPGGDLREENPVTRPVCQINQKSGTVIRIFNSANHAERETSILARNIGACCLHQGQITAGGFCWSFEDELENFVIPQSKRNKARQQPVYCYELDRTFESISEASTITGIRSDGICACCNNHRGGQYSAGGFQWCFLKDKGAFVPHIKKAVPHIKKAVVQIEVQTLQLVGLFESITEAEKETGVSRQAIGKTAKGDCITAGHYYWCFKEKYYEGWRPDNFIRGYGYSVYAERRKEIYCITSRTTYPCLAVASKETGISLSSICQCCRKQLNKAGNMQFCYLDEWESGSYSKRLDRSTKSVVCFETCEKFESIKDAAKKFNISASNITYCLKNKHRTAGGYHWRYIYEYDINEKPERQRVSVMKKVQCIETGKCYPSIRDAAIACHITEQNICRSCRDEKKSAGGSHWKYI